MPLNQSNNIIALSTNYTKDSTLIRSSNGTLLVMPVS